MAQATTAWQSYDGKLFDNKLAAEQHEFDVFMKAQFENFSGAPLTATQIDIIWRIRFDLANFILSEKKD